MNTFVLIVSLTLVGLPDEGQPLTEAQTQPVSLDMAALSVTSHEQCRIEGDRLMIALGSQVISAEYDCVTVPAGTDF